MDTLAGLYANDEKKILIALAVYTLNLCEAGADWRHGEIYRCLADGVYVGS